MFRAYEGKGQDPRNRPAIEKKVTASCIVAAKGARRPSQQQLGSLARPRGAVESMPNTLNVPYR